MGLSRRASEKLSRRSGFSSAGMGSGGDGHVDVYWILEDLSCEVGFLEHLRAILMNPLFVPIEEVAVREDEIHGLHDGRDRMGNRCIERARRREVREQTGNRMTPREESAAAWRRVPEEQGNRRGSATVATRCPSVQQEEPPSLVLPFGVKSCAGLTLDDSFHPMACRRAGFSGP